MKMLISTFCLFVFHKQQMLLEGRERNPKRTSKEKVRRTNPIMRFKKTG